MPSSSVESGSSKCPVEHAVETRLLTDIDVQPSCQSATSRIWPEGKDGVEFGPGAVIVWRLDRLGRNMRGIINTLHELTERGVTLRSLHDGVDTSTSTGRMVAGILMSIAEYERELVRERTVLKLEHARKSGRKFGQPAKLNGDQAALARRMKANGETAATICETLGIGRTTLYRYLAESAED
ncbi:recombinase family protein [Mycobacterium sp.]|uniref:recombinase family protein n=1 Tax=Mycobacterium sp. TaxID=1785 RepID=UPI003F95FF26